VIARARVWLRANYYVVMPYLVMVALIICSLFYTNYAIHRSDHELCELIAPIEAANQHAPPVSPGARVFATAIHDQFVKRGC